MLPTAGSAHLDRLLAECDRLAREVTALAATVDPATLARVARASTEASVRATLTLDGADPDLTAGERAGTWFDAFGRMTHAPTSDADGAEGTGHGDAVVSDVELAALERAGVEAALDADDLVERLVREPLAGLAELSRRLTDGLVAPERAGRVRTGPRIVHDASVGRVLYHPVAPERIVAGLEALADWVVAAHAAGAPVLIIAGTVHHGLLDLHPFDAANGRLARAATRLTLRGGGLDPGRLGSFEPALAEDALGIAEEVAATRRRRDLTVFVERTAEAVAAGLRSAADALGRQPPDVLDEARAALARALADGRGIPAGADGVGVVTLAAYAEARGLDVRMPAEREAAWDELASLIDARLVRRVPGARGLRYAAAGSAASHGSTALA